MKRKAILFFFGCSEVNSTWLITSELANQHARKALFTCVVYTNRKYWFERSIQRYVWQQHSENYYIVLFWFLFSHGKSVYVCSWSFYPLLNENVFFIQYKCCIDTRFSRCSSQEFAGFTVCKKFPFLLSIFIYPSIYFKIVWPQVCFSLLVISS